MSAQQLHLFDPPKPLLQRFGPGFFKAVPRKPGIYIMSGDAGRVLYIGQSGNLRARLGAYKNARPDHAPRKIIRLIHSVRSLVWEECETKEAACLKETQLLRIHRPRFNVQNTFPQAYRFIGLRQFGNDLNLDLVEAPLRGEKFFGAFKSGAVYAFGALLRLLWAALHQPRTHHDFPALLLHAKPPRVFRLSPHEAGAKVSMAELAALLEDYLSGRAERLIPWLTTALTPQADTSTFQHNLQTEDLETLTGFYERGPKRNLKLRQKHGVAGTIIAAELLDDLLAVTPRESLRKSAQIEQSALELEVYK